MSWYLLLLAALLFVSPLDGAAPARSQLRAPVAEARALSVSTDDPFPGDGPLLATVSPDGDGHRDNVLVRFYLTAPARVTVRALAAQRSFQRVPQPRWSVRQAMERGWQEVVWSPSRYLEPTTYVIVMSVASGGRTSWYGRLTHDSAVLPGPIVRILGAEASFDHSSYTPGETATLTVWCDAASITLRVVDVAGSDIQPTVNRLDGPDVIAPQHLPWDANRERAATIPVPIGAWRPGVYFAVVQSDTGEVGYAPLIVRAAQPTGRVAVLVPDHTWFAYDFHDDDLDGFPDSWYYPGGSPVARLARPFAHHGVPWQFGSQTWPFLRWLVVHGADADFLAEDDAIALGPALGRDYDLIVVPTHLEYVTAAEYDDLQRFRDQGGDLIFLASNNFYWRVEVGDGRIHRDGRWRDVGRPEAALVGAQYSGSKAGDAAPYVIAPSPAASWIFAGTGLTTDDSFSYAGNEFDVRTAASPPDTQLIATVRTPFHRGEMTYYETGEAKVFASGTYFSGRLLQTPESRLAENVWNHSDAPDLPRRPAR